MVFEKVGTVILIRMAFLQFMKNRIFVFFCVWRDAWLFAVNEVLLRYQAKPCSNGLCMIRSETGIENL